jgi:serine/threonine-protein kinase
MDPKSQSDIWLLPLEGDEKSGWKPGTPKVFLNGPSAETNPRISPDGRWLAYQSNESGRMEVYVRPLASSGGKWMISNAGGTFPRWSRTAKEIFFRSPDNTIMAAAYRAAGESLQADKPVLWSPSRIAGRGTFFNFDVAPDGKRMAVLANPESEENAGARIDKFVMVLNVFDELRRRVPAGKK